MPLDIDALQQQLPFYLTGDPERRALIRELKALSEGATKGYFIPAESDPYNGTMLQGDGWGGLQIVSLSDGESRSIRGIILSNSCDISDQNPRPLAPKIAFAPLVRLSRLRECFVRKRLDAGRIENKLRDIRSQKVTSIFYLPADQPLDDEYVVLLDDIHSIHVSVNEEKRQKIFTLSMAGFYLFVFKLSVHFCRLHENVDRRGGNAFGGKASN